MAKAKTTTEEPLEKQLWKAADKLRKNIDAAEYKHVVLGLIFLKYISDSFEEQFAKLQAGEGEYEGADPEDRDEHQADNIFFVPQEARWSFLQAQAKQPKIGNLVDEAMDAIEKENASLKGVLPKVFGRQNLDSTSLGELLRIDGRWQYGVPPAGNANFAWLQHFIYHLAPEGQAGVVLSKGALTSKTSGEGDIRKALIEDGNLIDCIVNLPAKLFLNTQIPAALWFMRRNRNSGKFKNRSNEILFIDARNLGHLINRRTRELSPEDIKQIANTYHNWRNPEGNYEDIKGFCCSAPISRVAELDYVLTAGRYVGLPDEEDDFDFKERFASLKAEFEAQLLEEAKLNNAIAENLAKITIGD